MGRVPDVDVKVSGSAIQIKTDTIVAEVVAVKDMCLVSNELIDMQARSSHRAGFLIAVWCNGSTQVGKGQSLPTGDGGSSPPTATNKSTNNLKQK